MTKYLVSASISITVENLKVEPRSPFLGTLEEELNDVIAEEMHKRLTLLDHRGAKSGEDGNIDQISCESVDGWEAQ